jgi:hypothetical protein
MMLTCACREAETGGILDKTTYEETMVPLILTHLQLRDKCVDAPCIMAVTNGGVQVRASFTAIAAPFVCAACVQRASVL